MNIENISLIVNITDGTYSLTLLIVMAILTIALIKHTNARKAK
jgi:hypothetical protein